jgi:hypothetical protein
MTTRVTLLAVIQVRVEIEELKDIETIRAWGNKTTIFIQHYQLMDLGITHNFLHRHRCIASLASLPMECLQLLLWTLWILKWATMHLSSCHKCKQWHSCNNNSIWVTCISRCNRCKLNNKCLCLLSLNSLIFLNNLLLRWISLQAQIAITSIPSINPIFWSIVMILISYHNNWQLSLINKTLSQCRQHNLYLKRKVKR